MKKLIHSNLILGFIDGYSIQELAPFVLSARKYVPNADIILGVSRTRPEAVEFLKAHGVRCIYCPGTFHHGEKWWKKLCANRHDPESYRGFLWKAFLYHYYLLLKKGVSWWWHHGPRARSLALASWYQQFLPSTNRRYFLYREWLSQLPDLPERILLTDVSDVIFQGNPFERVEGEGVEFAEENREQTIGTMTLAWLQWTGNKREAEILKERPVLCSGTTLGSGKAIYQYLQGVVARLSQSTSAMVIGLDQGAHYHVGYEMIASGQGRVHANGDGFVLTMATISPEAVTWLGDKIVMAGAEQVCPLVHQYNRHPRLLGQLRSLFKN